MYGLITYDATTDIELFESTVVSGRTSSVTEYNELKRFAVIVADHWPDVYFENRTGAENFCFGHFRSSANPSEPVFIVLLDPIHPMVYQAKRDGIYGLTNVEELVKKLFAPNLPSKHREQLDKKAAIDTRNHLEQESQKNLLSLIAVAAFLVLIMYFAI